jgi:hypothetical protein
VERFPIGARARIVRVLDALYDGEIDFAVAVLEDLLLEVPVA